MDRTRFSDRKTGQLLEIRKPAPDWAFVPDPLPPGCDWITDLMDLLLEARDRLGTLDGIGRTLPNAELLLRPLQDREAIQSSKLEGTYANPEDLHLFAKSPREPKSESDPANSWLEVLNYSRALHAGYGMLKTHPFTLNLVREMHHQLMTGVRGREKTPGEFRQIQVGIGTDHRYIPPPPGDPMKGALYEMEKFMNQPMDQRTRLIRPFLIHYQFEAIHPFLDGNGRIGRLLLALMIYKSCNLEMPWLYLSPFFEKYKEDYISKMFRVSTHGEWKEWIEFCLRGTIDASNDAITRCEMLRVLRDRYTERLKGNATTRSHAIVNDLFDNPIIGASEIRKKLGVSHKTARADIDVLLRTGILKKIPKHYPALFYAWEVFRIAYRDRPALATDDEVRATIAVSFSSGSEQPSSQSSGVESELGSPPEPSHPSTPQVVPALQPPGSSQPQRSRAEPESLDAAL